MASISLSTKPPSTVAVTDHEPVEVKFKLGERLDGPRRPQKEWRSKTEVHQAWRG